MVAKDDYTPDFEAWYSEYPRKEGKRDGFKAWKTMPLGAQQAALGDVQKRNRYNAWSPNRRLIPLPGTYLRGARYEDDWFTTFKSPQDEKQKPNTGAVDWQPQDPGYQCSKWEALANRLGIKWLRHARGLDDAELRTFRTTLRSTVRELSGPMDEEVAAGQTQEAVWTFAKTLCQRLDHDLKRSLAGQVLNLRERRR